MVVGQDKLDSKKGLTGVVRIGLDTIKRDWNWYCFKKYCIVLFHSLEVLLTVLASTMMLAFIKDCPESYYSQQSL